MEQAQPETQNPSEKHFSVSLIFAAFFAAIYFFFPAILLYPFFLVYGQNRPPSVQTTIEIVFYPDIKIAEAVPAYERFIDWEGSLLGMP